MLEEGAKDRPVSQDRRLGLVHWPAQSSKPDDAILFDPEGFLEEGFEEFARAAIPSEGDTLWRQHPVSPENVNLISLELLECHPEPRQSNSMQGCHTRGK